LAGLLTLRRAGIRFIYKPNSPGRKSDRPRREPPGRRPRPSEYAPERSRMSYRRPLPALLLVGLAAGCHSQAGPQAVALPPVEVPVATPLTREVVDYEEYPGKVMAVERVNVMARADGYLTEIKFQPGQLVKAGEI